jgi:hypothetical protein
MEPDFSPHPEDEQLELYAMNRVPEPQLPALEEHLLVCKLCQERLMDAQNYVQAMKSGTRNVSEQEPQISWTRPWPVWAAAVAVLLIAFFLATPWGTPRLSEVAPATILLSVRRGSENTAEAPADRRLVMLLDALGLPNAPEYPVEAVDSTGKSVWHSQAVMAGRNLRAHTERPFPAGTYFVRVYTPARELLREYRLTVQ